MPLIPKQQPPYYETNSTVKQYITQLTQSGTAPPISTPIINTVGTITTARSAPGRYTLVSNGLFTANKCFIPNTVYAGATGNANSPITLKSGPAIIGYINIDFDETDENTIYITSVDETFADTELVDLIGTSKLQLQFTIYP